MTQDRPILAPTCPGCAGPPLVTDVLPYFCQDVDCRVLTWDPYEDPAKFKAKAVTVELPDWMSS